MSGAANFVERLTALASERPKTRAFTGLDDGETETAWLSYGELHARALAVAAALRATGFRRGDRALLLFPPGLDFIVGFFGCLYAGVVAVPAYPPDPGRLARTLPRLVAIVRDCRPHGVLTTSFVRALASAIDAPELATVPWIAVDEATDGAITLESPQPSDLAFLQYTSGSTAAPKGVMVTHQNLLANSQDIASSEINDADSRAASWLPTFHDMGLIDGVLQPIWGGFPCWLMPPQAFLQRPARWLELISRCGITNSGSPNFGYALCVRKVSDAEHARLDLSRWRVAYNGSEPARWQTMQRFIERFGSRGFNHGVAAVYGMAEATLFVSGRTRLEPARVLGVDRHALEDGVVQPGGELALASCGRAKPSFSIRIIDPKTRLPLGPDRVGEICVRGASVAAGYWNDLVRTSAAFDQSIGTERGYFRTGDLGFLHDDELYVTGRLKDLLIVRGRNIIPSDVEQTVESTHSVIRAGCAVAFGVQVDGSEALAIAAEVDLGLCHDYPQLVADIRQNVVWKHDVAVAAIVLLTPRTVPKTSSGKLRRQATRDGFFAGSLSVVYQDRLPALDPPRVPPAQAWVAWCAEPLDADRLGAAAEAIVGARPALAEHLFVPESTPEISLGYGGFVALDVAPADLERTVAAAAFDPTGAGTERPFRLRLLRSATHHALVATFPRGTTTTAAMQALMEEILRAYEGRVVAGAAPTSGNDAGTQVAIPADMSQTAVAACFDAWAARIEDSDTVDASRYGVLAHAPFSAGALRFEPLVPRATPFALALVHDGVHGRLLGGDDRLRAAWSQSLTRMLAALPSGTALAVHASEPRERPTIPAQLAALATGLRAETEIKSAEDVLTLRQIAASAELIAARLHAAGVERGATVAIVAEPGLAHLRALAGVWRAGACALLLAPDLPDLWAADLVRAAGARVLLRSANELRSLASLVRTVTLPEPQDAVEPFTGDVAPDDKAFVHFVSYDGVAEPVPLVHTHRTLADQAAAWLELVDSERIALRAPPSSIHAYVEAAAALSGSVSTYVSEANDLRCHASFGARAFANDVRGVAFVPTYVRAMMSAMLDGGERLGNFRRVLLRGEAAGADVLARLDQRMPAASRHFVYSIAELGGIALVADDPSRYEALPGVRAVVLDRRGDVAPPGMWGELCLAAPWLAHGIPPDRLDRGLFRTGDRARADADGRIAIGPRRDTQEKVMGARVVRTQIASALRTHAGVADARVEGFVDPRGDLRLAAYVVSRDAALDDTALRQWLRKRVPEPALPGNFIFLPALPAQKSELPLPPWMPVIVRAEPPATETERRLAAVWSAILGIPGIGREQSFFELGGDSLLGLQVTHEAQARGIALRPDMISRFPKLRDMAAAIDACA